MVDPRGRPPPAARREPAAERLRRHGRDRAARAPKPDSRPPVLGDTIATALPACALARSLASVPLARRAHGRVGQHEHHRARRLARDGSSRRACSMSSRNPSASRRNAADARANSSGSAKRQHLGRQLDRRHVQVGDGLAVGVVVDGDAELLEPRGRRRRASPAASASASRLRRSGCRRTRPRSPSGRNALRGSDRRAGWCRRSGLSVDVRLQRRVRRDVAREVVVEVADRHARGRAARSARPGSRPATRPAPCTSSPADADAATRSSSAMSRLTPVTSVSAASAAARGPASRSCCSAHRPSASPLNA